MVSRMLTTVRQNLSYFRLVPFDTSTEAGRTSERMRRASLTFAASLGAKALSMMVLLLSLRMALPHLGSERFGIWMTLVSITSILAVLDFGVGNGLLSQVAALGGDRARLARVITTGTWVLAGIAAGLLALTALVMATLPVERVFHGIGSAVRDEARTSILVFLVLLALSQPFQAAHKIFQGLQRGYATHAVSLLASLASLAALLVLPGTGAGVPEYLFWTYGLQVLSGSLLLVRLAQERLLGRWRRALWAEWGGQILRGSGGFLLMQLVLAAAMGSDTLLAASVLGAGAVTPYALVQRIYMFVYVPVVMMNTPLWAAYADALTRGEHAFLRSAFRRSLAVAIGGALAGAVVLTLGFHPLARLFGGGEVGVSVGYVFSYGIWMTLEVTAITLMMYFNGVGLVRYQTLSGLAYLVLATVLKVRLLPELGLIALPLVSIATYVVVYAIPQLTFLRRPLFGLLSSPAPKGETT